jgi:L-fuculose-phosphate aldolase
MHLEVYRQRSDVRAVLHAHPVFATVLSVSDSPFPVDVLPEVLLTIGDVPTTRYATPSSHDDADAIRELIQNHDALLLRQHGSLTVGKDLEVALTNLERIEHVAEVFWRAKMLGKVNRIPEVDVEKLLQVRERFQSEM